MEVQEIVQKLPPIVGLTGGIGCGKSAACGFFASKQVPIVDADELARKVVEPGQKALEMIRDSLGEQFITRDGSLDRSALGKLVFNDPKARKTLQSITHPFIRQLYFETLKAFIGTKAPFIIYAVPLLFESGFSYDEIRLIVVVYADPKTCLDRIVKRDNCTKVLAEKKIASQIPIDVKAAKADLVIDNSGSLQELELEVNQAYNKIIAELK